MQEVDGGADFWLQFACGGLWPGEATIALAQVTSAQAIHHLAGLCILVKQDQS